MKEALTSLLGFILAMVVLVGAVLFLNWLFPDVGRNRTPQTEGFREACTRLGGEPAWNGRHWECLK